MLCTQVNLLLQGLKATLFELEFMLQVNHLPLELADLGGRRPCTGLIRGGHEGNGATQSPLLLLCNDWSQQLWATLVTTPSTHPQGS